MLSRARASKKGRGSCVLGPGSALTLLGSSDSIENRGERGVIMRTVREKEEELTLFDEGEKLRCEGDSILTHQTIFPFFFFFCFSFLPILEWKRYEKGLILFGERYWNSFVGL